MSTKLLMHCTRASCSSCRSSAGRSESSTSSHMDVNGATFRSKSVEDQRKGDAGQEMPRAQVRRSQAEVREECGGRGARRRCGMRRRLPDRGRHHKIGHLGELFHFSPFDPIPLLLEDLQLANSRWVLQIVV